MGDKNLLSSTSHIAEIAVENAVYSFDRPFSYVIPERLLTSLEVGMRVSVPFGAGNKLRVGVVLNRYNSNEDNEKLKEITAVLDKEPVLSQEMILLTFWMKERYYCTLFDAVKQMIPTGINLKLKNNYILSEDFKDFDGDAFNEIEWQIISMLNKAKKSLPFEKIVSGLGITEENPEFQALLEKEIVLKVNVASTKIKDAVSKMVRPISDFSVKLTDRQQSVYNTLLDVGAVSEKELRYFTGASPQLIKTLVEKGAAETFEYERYRRPEHFNVSDKTAEEVLLSEAQQKEFESLREEYDTQKPICSLLYGVTGSGKTSVFLKLIKHVYDSQKDIIVMVPEISLTSQTIKLFTEMFSDTVAVLHSGLSLGERLDEWKRIKRGEARIVVGTRSAVFAPVQNLGLIVMDEEQEHSYKSESSPRYDAREVARKRCADNSAMCLFCSATPSVETYYMTQIGRYSLHSLPERYGDAILPEVVLVDMGDCETVGVDSLISVPLYKMINETVAEGHQAIILLNRRGYHHFATCKECKEVLVCPNCSISLTYHSANNRLMCHYCGASFKLPVSCPSCKSKEIAFRGPGTQRVEEELDEIFPDARILRVDTDSVSAKFSLEKKLEEFSHGEYDIMVGTQMVAKGLDFENVTLVGVISADNMLFSDDFRSNERTFDLLTQVVGRSGRGKHVGKAMIQTYVPENPYLYMASQQDYQAFYEMEIQYRKALLYPPFADLLVLGFVCENEATVKRATDFMLNSLMNKAHNEHPNMPLRILKASPATVYKVSNKYRYKAIIKCRNTAEFRAMISQLLIDFPKNRDFTKVTVYADSNPYTIM